MNEIKMLGRENFECDPDGYIPIKQSLEYRDGSKREQFIKIREEDFREMMEKNNTPVTIRHSKTAVFTDKMRELSELFSDDEEAGHVEMDKLMCETLRSLGFEVGIDIFINFPKWYA